MLEVDSGPVPPPKEHEMIAVTSEALPSLNHMPQANTQAQALRFLAGQLKELVHGGSPSDADADAPFRDTMPAVCWAVPGAYATTIDG